MHIINCPVCGSKVNKAGHTLFCKCGWSKSFNKKAETKIQHKITKSIVIAGIGIMGAIVYIGNWGPSSIKIAPLKIRQWTSQLDTQSFTNLKNICMSLKKYDCVEKAHSSFFKSSGDLKVLEQLGDFQYRRKRFNQAYKTYSQYFTRKGKSVKAAYNYARILEQLGQTEFALSYYKFALSVQPGVIQVTVIRSYIDLLVKSGQSNKARQELMKLKPLLKRAGSLVQQEYKRWEKQTI